MKESCIVRHNGRDFFQIGEDIFPACAYIVYFDECNDYKGFAECGYRVFSVSLSMAKQAINTVSGFVPFVAGVFDEKNKPNYTAVDDVILRLLEVCPEAYIFPRINVCMPQWWIEEHPKEVVSVGKADFREALYSNEFREDGGKMLRQFIRYLKEAPYADHIFGYQICGGNTQEWFHLDPMRNGSYCENAIPYFNSFLERYYPDMPPVVELPSLDGLFTGGEIQDEYLIKYVEFSNDCVADTIAHFCRIVKEEVEYRQMVGVFYGYTAEVPYALFGTHRLSKLLDCKEIDFFASPSSYAEGRALGIDWGDMMPIDSIRLHGKTGLLELDIRTLLSRSPETSRKGSDSTGYYSDDLWLGPPTLELSISAIRKSFARQLTYGNGFWWFDLFGHWYAHESLMAEMKSALEIYRNALSLKGSVLPIEVAVFLDERMYSRLCTNHPAVRAAYDLRTPIGSCGCPYHVYLIDDFEKICQSPMAYKVFLFNIPTDCSRLSLAMNYCNDKQIPYLRCTEDKWRYTADELRRFFEECGVWCYCESNDVVYVGNGHIAIHSATEGHKKLLLQRKMKITALTEEDLLYETDALEIDMKLHETKLFRIEDIDSFDNKNKGVVLL